MKICGKKSGKVGKSKVGEKISIIIKHNIFKAQILKTPDKLNNYQSPNQIFVLEEKRRKRCEKETVL